MIDIRLMRENDLEEVMPIERQLFSSPWSEESYKNALKNSGTIFLVVEDEDEIIGYAGSYYSVGQADVATIGVVKDRQREGIAQQLLEALLDELRNKMTDTVFLEVRESNWAAIKLYRKFDFELVGIRSDYYDNPKENAIIMKRDLRELS